MPLLPATLALISGLYAAAGAEPPTFPVRVTGLFAPDREADLRALVKELPGVELVSLDFDHAEAVFRLDPKTVFPGTKPDQIITRLDEKVRQSSHGTFGVKPRSATPHDRWQQVVIPVVGLDCRACSLAAYEIVAKIDGVEQATASFREGRVTARIDPKRTDKAALEAALRQRGVALKQP